MQERFYFGDHVLPLFETGIPLLKQRLDQLPDADKVSIYLQLTVFVKYDVHVDSGVAIFLIITEGFSLLYLFLLLLFLL